MVRHLQNFCVLDAGTVGHGTLDFGFWIADFGFGAGSCFMETYMLRAETKQNRFGVTAMPAITAMVLAILSAPECATRRILRATALMNLKRARVRHLRHARRRGANGAGWEGRHAPSLSAFLSSPRHAPLLSRFSLRNPRAHAGGSDNWSYSSSFR